MNITEAWQKIAGPTVKMGRAGLIPIWDNGEWRLLRNTQTIWPYLENGADPVKVERLRRNVVSLMQAYPDTIPHLEQLGIRIKGLLNKPIKTPADVAQWAESMFNMGPVSADPAHVQDAKALVYDDFRVQVRGGKDPAYVIPAGARGSGVLAAYDYATPGSRLRYGSKHDFTQIAFAQQLPKSPQSRTAASNGSTRPRGRPRKDGLVPGSKEAKAADRKRLRDAEREQARRQREREKAKAAAEAAAEAKKALRKTKPKLATITELPPPEAPPMRRLVRVGSSLGVSV